MTRPLAWTIGLQLALMLLCSPARADDVRDLYFGEALFQAGQGKYFEALERLDAELGQHYGSSATSSSTTACIIARAAPSARS
jgi:hypothetical protein